MNYTPALSLRQPWLFAIFDLGKRLENRRWNTKYRGPIWLHAAKGCGKREAVEAFRWMEDEGHIRGTPATWPGLAVVDRGGLVGRAEIVDVLPPIERWRGTGETGRADVGDVLRQLGARGTILTRDDLRWWMREQYAFVLKNVVQFPRIGCRGELGLFKLLPKVEAVALAAVNGVCPCESDIDDIGGGHLKSCPRSNPNFVETPW